MDLRDHLLHSADRLGDKGISVSEAQFLLQPRPARKSAVMPEHHRGQNAQVLSIQQPGACVLMRNAHRTLTALSLNQPALPIVAALPNIVDEPAVGRERSRVEDLAEGTRPPGRSTQMVTELMTKPVTIPGTVRPQRSGHGRLSMRKICES
ncbi:hypothetical protein Msi02_06970 [Microbispora siamensis]|uniref:Uncharacterized protein n=1 Tax=Microbispora siamensis TaxID=564413 RepID=A0ABQ4GEM3_9ACTN|nr:hypothetical protein Msi02_06970 [Microbispora siamensis]